MTAPFPTSPTSPFAEQLLRVLPSLLAPGALPEDWEPGATTYDLPRFSTEAAFVERFRAVVGQLAADPGDPSRVRALLAGCGHPSDYARLGQPLSTVHELLVQALTGARRAIGFASRTKPFLAVVEARASTAQPVRLFCPGRLPVSDAKKGELRRRNVEIHEQWEGPLPPAEGALTVWVGEASGPLSELLRPDADAVTFPVEGGGVLLLANERIDPRAVQVVRKRTAGALLAADARAELQRWAGLPVDPAPEATPDRCEALLRGLFPELRAAAWFCTGLAAEASVFTATAAAVAGGRPLRLLYAQNGYGGTGQLIGELLSREGVVEPVPLPVVGGGATLVERMIEVVRGFGDEPACVFLETPTNPELQMHDFGRLVAALRQHEARTGARIPVLADTTLAPLYPLLAQPFARGWPCVVVKSGSKYFTRGKATLGVVFCGEDPLALRIVATAADLARDADTGARPSQLGALAAGLGDLPARMATIARNTARLAAGLREAMRARGRDLVLYTVSEAQVADGLASGVLSFYLPPAPSSRADLVDEFVDDLLERAPALVRSRVSYGQSTGGGRPDVFYVINPEESTQGALSQAVKAAQKRDGVQLCRVSVPERADVDGLLRAMSGFFDRKYGPIAN